MSEMSLPSFEVLPEKVLILIFKKFDQPHRQKFRIICQSWKKVIDEAFPVELIITQANYERMFRCTTAVAAEIQSLTNEYTGNVGFGLSLRSILFTGKVLSSNLFSILRYCPNLEALRFSSLKQVLGIEDSESVKLPKATLVEIRVRPDQETFTSDEIIVISILRQILFGSLETILISTGNFSIDTWEDDVDYDQRSEMDGQDTRSFTISAISPQSSEGHLSASDTTTKAMPSAVSVEESEPNPDPLGDEDATLTVTILVEEIINDALPEDETIEFVDSPAQTSEPQTFGTQTNPPNNLNVIMNRASHFTNGVNSSRNQATPASNAETSTSNASTATSTRRARYNLSEFEARLFYANLELLMERNMEASVIDVLNGSASRTAGSSMYFDAAVTPAPILKSTVFFEFVRNNHTTVRNLYVKTRADFMCFGSLNAFTRDLAKVQFEEVEYSFGRTQMCYEQQLLTAQCRLRKLKVQILDDLWRHLMTAVGNSQETLSDLDVKVIGVADDRLDIIPITNCYNLKTLKLLHFFEKESLRLLPQSLNKLIINGPIYYKDMDTWTKVLLNMEDLTMLLNERGDKIDLPLFKKFLRIPKMCKMTFIQCPMELNEIFSYIESSDLTKNGLKFWINGPREIGDMPSIQYVYTLINPDTFNRAQIQMDDVSGINQS